MAIKLIRVNFLILAIFKNSKFVHNQFSFGSIEQWNQCPICNEVVTEWQHIAIHTRNNVGEQINFDRDGGGGRAHSGENVEVREEVNEGVQGAKEDGCG